MTKKHLFLTGEKQVGKSTLLQKLLLKNEACPTGGFHTVRSAGVFPGRSSVHLLSCATGEQPSAENLLFFCDLPEDAGTARRFDRLGIAALALPARRIVMDELGPAEKNARLFQQRVLALLDGDTPILGVLQKCDAPFLQTVALHPRVQVITVTTENRDRLAEELQG